MTILKYLVNIGTYLIKLIFNLNIIYTRKIWFKYSDKTFVLYFNKWYKNECNEVLKKKKKRIITI